ncbi:GNAT family N-acetyltransferase [Vibrio owensii]|uniref:GNAT family N-acetyltransferase n=1 Tax=Vibrio owensii TaxID=696485 RepID=UPI002894588A|nr:Ribosomal-protein-serine acetyltransferase [Vibrio owensii]
MYQGYEKHQLRQITERISIEPLLTKHATPLLAAVNKSREHLSQYLPWTDWVTNRREAVAYISQRINSNAFEAYWFAIRLDQNFVGVLGLKGVNQETGVAEVGYWLAEQGHGHRIIDHVLSVLLPLVRERGQTSAVQFHCMEGNVPSIKIAERAGAVLKEYVDHDFEMLDSRQRLGIYELVFKAHPRTSHLLEERA